MPRKPRSQAMKYKRRAKQSHIPKLIEIRDDLFEYHVFALGESESANELAVKAQVLAQALDELKEAYEQELIKWM